MVRRCAKCGKDTDVSGGKTCLNDHFICWGCVVGGFIAPSLTTCPLCGNPLK